MLLVQPSKGHCLGELLKKLLTDPNWTEFIAAVAFVKRSGIQHIENEIRSFLEKGRLLLIVGVDLGGTSKEGLDDLLKCVDGKGEIWVYHNEAYSTFHPKVYVFNNSKEAIAIVGSNNLTEGGLFTNTEVSNISQLDLSAKEDMEYFNSIKEMFEEWLSPESDLCKKLTAEFLEDLYNNGYVVDEYRANGDERGATDTKQQEFEEKRKKLFGNKNIARPSFSKSRDRGDNQETSAQPKGASSKERTPSKNLSFVMTLQQTDAGKGQITPGTPRRSPEIFIPLAARDANPNFWGWPSDFEEDAAKRGKYDRRDVQMSLSGNIIHVNMMTWPDKHDFRLRAEALRSAGDVGDILRIQKTLDSKIPYEVEVITKSAQDFAEYLNKCSQNTKNSKKKWGYF